MLENAPIVAVVDDDLGIREALADLIMSLGYEARAYAAGEEFLRSNHHERIGLMLVDFVMTGMSGIDLVKCLASRGTCPPFIMMTSHCEARIRDAAIAEGAVGFLSKPFDTEVLVISIHDILKGEPKVA
ncbi:response regulator transcription factor [Aliirhizobium cellulosilyticum]|nr:response regulator [Rhizobium cellulosilyticum]